jgi:flagellar biosynthesis protein FlhG
MQQSNKRDPVIQDQAESLRRTRFMKQAVEQKVTRSRAAVSRVMSFTSGKGGVGKTSMVVNTAVALARAGKSVLILDADLGLANVDVLLGLKPTATLLDVFEGRASLDEIMVEGPEGISIIPAASGVESICNLDAGRQMLLMQAVENMAPQFDYLLIDTQAGISSDVMYFNSAASEIVVVITGEPTSLTDAYALIKVLSQNYGEHSFSVIANNVRDERDGQRAFGRLHGAVTQFLQVQVRYLGFVPADSAMQEAIRSQRSLMELFPSSKAALAVGQISRRIDEAFHEHRVKGGMQFFFNRLLEVSASDR